MNATRPEIAFARWLRTERYVIGEDVDIEALADLWRSTISDTQTEAEDTLGPAVKAAKDAAYGDSNDEEIELLQDALDEALLALGRQDLRDYESPDAL